jgi:hypothetical protein
VLLHQTAAAQPPLHDHALPFRRATLLRTHWQFAVTMPRDVKHLLNALLQVLSSRVYRTIAVTCEADRHEVLLLLLLLLLMLCLMFFLPIQLFPCC